MVVRTRRRSRGVQLCGMQMSLVQSKSFALEMANGITHEEREALEKERKMTRAQAYAELRINPHYASLILKQCQSPQYRFFDS